MRSAAGRRVKGMSTSAQAPTTVTNIGVAMFTVSGQDAAIAFSTEEPGRDPDGNHVVVAETPG